jgi:hypothetical protein
MGKMAAKLITSTREYQGLSTDTKPTLDKRFTGSTYLEIGVDGNGEPNGTTKLYTWHIDKWVEVV